MFRGSSCCGSTHFSLFGYFQNLEVEKVPVGAALIGTGDNSKSLTPAELSFSVPGDVWGRECLSDK